MDGDKILRKTIIILFALLFFFLPLFFTPYNSELFEFNKILLLYFLTVLIAGAWVGRMILAKKLIFRRTPFDLPLVLFLLSQILSTIFSIDRHTSIFGYYSRFNGGLASTVSYLILFWALVSNCETKAIIKYLKVSFASALIVSLWGILEHFGHSFSCLMFEGNFGVSCWIQDVKSRVFASLGQPNWLAAWLAILIPLTLAFSDIKQLIQKSIYYLLFIIYYLCLLFTGSRSGYAGLVLGLFVFWLFTFFLNRQQLKTALSKFFLFAIGYLIFTIIFGTPFPQINRYFSLKSWQEMVKPKTVQLPTVEQPLGPQLEVGGSESGAIRKIVWKGAIDIFKHYPLFGSGVETFAYSYYNFRPPEHNLVSEWDFLYNKAHNEYLNFLATTGIFGLGTYLFFIFSFIIWSLKNFWQNTPSPSLRLALFSGWLTILVSNFFGFSVVLVSLYFFLIPAFYFLLSSSSQSPQPIAPKSPIRSQLGLFVILLPSTFYLLSSITNLWRADYYYAIGDKLAKQNQYLTAYQNLHRAITISPNEPVFLSNLSLSAANLSLLTFSQKEATASQELATLAVSYSDKAKNISPRNLNLLKTRIKVFYTLSLIKPAYLKQTTESLLETIKLAPTDPKLVLNLGLVYNRAGKVEEGLRLIHQSVEMKPNYEEARQALAIIYEELEEKQKAIEQYEYISKLIRPDDLQLKEKIENLKK